MRKRNGYIDIGSLVFLLVAVLMVGLIGTAAIESINQARVERTCLAHGWPHADWRWIGPSYCIKRVNQTDTTATLEQVIRR